MAFAGVAVALGTGAHLAGGGELPGLGALGLLTVPVAWVSFFLVRAWRGWPAVLASLVLVEAGLHEGLMVLSGPVGHASPAGAMGQGAMMMGDHAPAVAGTASAMPSAGAAVMPVPGAAMIVAHLVATVLTGAALAYGEELLRRLWTWLHHAFTLVVGRVRLPAARAVTPGWLLTVNPVPVLVGRRIRRRGPPVPPTALPACT